jgi:hypothetical protein
MVIQVTHINNYRWAMKLWFAYMGEAVSLVLDLVIERIVAYKQL